LPHRIVMAPMNRNRARPDGSAPPLAATYFSQRASGGLQISGALHVSPLSVAAPGGPRLHTVAHCESWKTVTSALHAAGGHLFAQLRHAGRLSPVSGLPEHQRPVAPSAIAARGADLPRALTGVEIAAVVGEFLEASRLAMAAGFDGIELHGGNGYLIDQFLRDGSNHRTDVYGGPVTSRSRFLHEILDAVATVCEPARIGVRLTPHAAHNDMQDSDPAATFIGIARGLRGRGLAYLHVVEGVPGDPESPPQGVPRIAGAMRSAFAGPMLLTGGFNLMTAEQALTDGRADLIGFAKAFLANPDLPQRLARGATLNAPDRATFYESASDPERGYIDYPTLDPPTPGPAPARPRAGHL
jgi:N-ethylmaleimide reductase